MIKLNMYENPFSSWAYNVIDEFKPLTQEQIKRKLEITAHPFAICMERTIGDFNFGTMIRNANAFNAKEVFYLGDKKWDRRSAVGVYNYTKVKYLKDISELKLLNQQYTIIGVDNIVGKSIQLSDYKFIPNTLFIFGEEGIGLTPQIQEICSSIVEIKMFGSVRSLNCGVASGIIMHEYVSWLKKL